MSRHAQRMAPDLLPALIDQREVDWRRVASLSYLVRQRIRYEYPRPVRDLRHRLMIVPPDRHGDQRTVVCHVSASSDGDTRRWRDEYGNVCIEFCTPAVQAWIEFEARIVVHRAPVQRPPLHRPGWLTDPRLLRPTALTAPARSLVRVARRLRKGGHAGLELAEAVSDWVHGALAYESGVTDVATTAAGALALGRGVCQDHAHLMLALCRLLGLPARYVSGHLLGEGGTHAWVEVLLPDPAGSGRAAAFAFDPSHGSRPGLDHVTVATGRDYRDVAPTAGTYVGCAAGRLSASKRVDIVGVVYARSGGRAVRAS
jgi:transglutaminase-like putative cysteine protease